MKETYIATHYAMSKGVGRSTQRLPSFDKALLDAGVGNYNLVKLSSILPSECKEVSIGKITSFIKEGSLLPTAFATITSSIEGEKLASAVAVGIPVDKEKVGVIMEFSGLGIDKKDAENTVVEMVREAFWVRRWELDEIKYRAVDAVVGKGETVSTFACIAEW